MCQAARENTNCTDGCLVFFEHVTQGHILISGRNAQGLAKARELCYSDQFISAAQSSARVKQCLWTDILLTPLLFNVCNL